MVLPIVTQYIVSVAHVLRYVSYRQILAITHPIDYYWNLLLFNYYYQFVNFFWYLSVFSSVPQHPYPSEEQKKQLAQDTGLTILQVNNWWVFFFKVFFFFF